MRIAGRSAAVVWLLFAAIVCSCHHGRTQIVLRVETDMDQGPGREVDAIHIVIRSSDEATPRFEHTLDLGEGSNRLLLPQNLLGISPRDNDPTRVVTVEIEPIAAGVPMFLNRARTTFVPDQTSLLDVFLARQCRALSCSDGFTCGRNGCEPEQRPSLPPFDYDASTDASAPSDVSELDSQTEDVVTEMDAAVETGATDVAISDGAFDAVVPDGTADAASDVAPDAPVGNATLSTNPGSVPVGGMLHLEGCGYVFGTSVCSTVVLIFKNSSGAQVAQYTSGLLNGAYFGLGPDGCIPPQQYYPNATVAGPGNFTAEAWQRVTGHTDCVNPAHLTLMATAHYTVTP
jgi:hypothetical protein